MGEPLNPLDYADNPNELEVQKELRRLGIKNELLPECVTQEGLCPKCRSELKTGDGMVGETVIYCPNGCYHWEDSEDAIRRVY